MFSPAGNPPRRIESKECTKAVPVTLPGALRRRRHDVVVTKMRETTDRRVPRLGAGKLPASQTMWRHPDGFSSPHQSVISDLACCDVVVENGAVLDLLSRGCHAQRPRILLARHQ